MPFVYEIVRSFGGKQRWIGRGRFQLLALNFVAATAPVATASMSRLDRVRQRALLYLPANRAGNSLVGLQSREQTSNAPLMRPVLPRISSQQSGFFFCGIRLLPVENSPAG